MGEKHSEHPQTVFSNLSLMFQNSELSHLVESNSSASPVGRGSISSVASLVLPIVYTLICSCGVLANALIICTVLSCKQKCVSDIYILNLAIADLLFLVGMPFIIHQLIQEKGWVFGEFLCRAVTTIDLNNQFTSVAIVTVLCIDRYIAVVYSSTAGLKRTMKCTVTINISIWIYSLLLATPAMLYAKVQRENLTELCLIDLPEPRSIYWYTLYQSILAFIIPVVIITLLYSLTLHHLFKVMKKVQKKRSTRSKKVTRMALIIIAAFLICWTPFHVVQLINLNATPSMLFYYLYQSTICLSYAHSCVNPILMIFFTEFFREKIIHTRFCRLLLALSGAGNTSELPSSTYNPNAGNSSIHRKIRNTGSGKSSHSVTEAAGISTSPNGEETSVV
ncbi:melanin-concentrating hormone receptor 2-like [Protopterus annectens]|uniref:melanin-concentrating hormone receptor 2-like n=1 Tax=Protopterus annectens TaxID=7888 RepID=UPI001CFBF468|nr:melanin-concentrating hormone receptor 2-like [Protopterus annectens]